MSGSVNNTGTLHFAIELEIEVRGLAYELIVIIQGKKGNLLIITFSTLHYATRSRTRTKSIALFFFKIFKLSQNQWRSLWFDVFSC